MKRNLWTREELIVALSLYLKLPFGKISHRTPEVKQLAILISRTPNAVSMRLSNFASVDPYHQERGIKGLQGGIRQVQPIWDEFVENREELLFESEAILTDLEKRSLEDKFPSIFDDIANLQGEVKNRIVKTRVNQRIFRDIVLSNYSQKCAISNINISSMLIASHIIPWSKNRQERLNPTNGICLSPHFDTAFDKGLISFDETYKLILAKSLKDHTTTEFYEDWFKRFEGIKLNDALKYKPHREFLEWHRVHVFT